MIAVRSTFPLMLAVATAVGAAALPAQRPSRFDAGVASFLRFESPVVALSGATLIDGTGAAPRRDVTILWQEGRITAVGPASAIAVPEGAHRVDATGHTVMPGFVFMHEHLFYPTGGPGEAIYNPQYITFPRLYLAFGITTARTAGTVNFDGERSLREFIDRGLNVGPRLVLYAPYVNGRTPGKLVYQWTPVEGAEDVRRRVEFHAALGADGFKAYEHVSRAELGALIDAAHARGLKVTAHLCSVTWPEAIALGIDNLEHGLMVNSQFVAGKRPDECPGDLPMAIAASNADLDGEAVRSLTATLISRGIAVTSTPTIWESFTGTTDFTSEAALQTLLPQLREELAGIQRVLATRPDSTFARTLRKELAWERDFFRAGGHLVVGTDPTGFGGIIAGFGSMRALELLASSGLRAEEVVRVASLNGARFLGRDHELGSIEVGKRADLIMVRGDVSNDITALRNPVLVVKDGVGYDSQKLIASVRGLVGLR